MKVVVASRLGCEVASRRTILTAEAAKDFLRDKLRQSLGTFCGLEEEIASLKAEVSALQEEVSQLRLQLSRAEKGEPVHV